MAYTTEFLFILNDNDRIVGVLRHYYYNSLKNTKIWEEYRIYNQLITKWQLERYLANSSPKFQNLFYWFEEENRWLLKR